jgi:hypothetical protein
MNTANTKFHNVINLKKANLIRLKGLLESNGSIKDIIAAKETNEILSFEIENLRKILGIQQQIIVSTDIKNESENPFSNFSTFKPNPQFIKVSQEYKPDHSFLIPKENLVLPELKINIPDVKQINSVETQMEKFEDIDLNSDINYTNGYY